MDCWRREAVGEIVPERMLRSSYISRVGCRSNGNARGRDSEWVLNVEGRDGQGRGATKREVELRTSEEMADPDYTT